MPSRWYYWDKQKKEMVAGYRPIEFRPYGTAPIVIFDSMPKTYHHGLGYEIDSRAEWRLADKQAGTLTFGSLDEAKPQAPTDDKEARRRDIRQARERAVAALENPDRRTVTDDQKEIFKKSDEALSAKLGFDVNKLWKPKRKKK